jgi:hypothetical protein
MIGLALVSTSTFADSPTKAKIAANDKEVAVFVTGSLIPQRIKLHPTGTKTVSPVRIIDRAEIDQNGRPTTPGALINDPAVQIVPIIRH